MTLRNNTYHLYDIDLSDIKDKTITFWSAGNDPTQKQFALSEEEVKSHLKSLYLLSDIVAASASFYYESPITRSITEQLIDLFKGGEILYFTDSTVEGFTEHAAEKKSTSPAEIKCYHDKDFVINASKQLDSMGFILRRPSGSISDKIVELWSLDIHSRHLGTLGYVLSNLEIEEKTKILITDKLISLGNHRDKSFVWEYIGPKMKDMGLPLQFLRLARKRLSKMYAVATASILGAPLDISESFLYGNHITESSKYDTSLFLNCMEVLRIKKAFTSLTIEGLLILKKSIEYVYFREFYFSLINCMKGSPKDIITHTPMYEDAEINYYSSILSKEEFINEFSSYCQLISKKDYNFSQPLDILLKTYDLFGRLSVADFRERVYDLYQKKARAFEFDTKQHREEKRKMGHPHIEKRIIDLSEGLNKRYDLLRKIEEAVLYETRPIEKERLIKQADDIKLNIFDYSLELEQLDVNNETDIISIEDKEKRRISMMNLLVDNCTLIDDGLIVNIINDINEILSEISKLNIKINEKKSIEKDMDLLHTSISVKDKLKFTIPLIPLFMKYEGEISAEGKLALGRLWGKMVDWLKQWRNK